MAPTAHAVAGALANAAERQSANDLPPPVYLACTRPYPNGYTSPEPVRLRRSKQRMLAS